MSFAKKQFLTTAARIIFCSKSCSAQLNNTLRAKKKPEKVCRRESCQNSARKVFCSFGCSVEHKKDLRRKDFELGKLKPWRAKKVLIELYTLKCMDCNWAEINPTSGKCPVDLEHVDGNSENNFPSNLKLMCPNCHALTPTYKTLNIGKGRASRRERYHAGKSY